MQPHTHTPTVLERRAEKRLSQRPQVHPLEVERTGEGGCRVPATAGVRTRHVNHCSPVNNKEKASPQHSADSHNNTTLVPSVAKTDRQTDRQTGRQTDKKTDRQTERKKERKEERKKGRKKGKQKEQQTEKQ